MTKRCWSGAFALLVSTAALAQSTGPHPRLILDTATLDGLHAKIAANTAQWQRLKSYCDSFINGTVNYPAVGGDQDVGTNDYPDAPNIGQGYEGDGYWAPLMSEGLCYRALYASDPTTAAKYGQKAADIAVTLSTPTTDTMRSEDPCTDDGYVIRFYGVGMGILYDWAYDKFTQQQRTQIYTTANQWLGIWDSNGVCPKNLDGSPAFAYGNPLGNYFAGYFHAKTVVALATAGENPSAPAQWTNWQNVQYNTAATNPPHTGVQPYFAAHMKGGGWPEGFGNYGPLATLNMSLPVWEVKTATGADLVNAAAPYTFPIDAADYLMYFTWPNRAYIDDRDTNHSSGDSGAPPPSSANVGMFMQVLGVLRYWNAPHANVFQEYTNEVLAARGDDDVDAWEAFLFYDPNGATAPLATLPLSYFAPGPNAIAARSDWTTDATWMSFRAGPYIEGGGGEEGFDQGSLALVRGGVPLLVNGTGWAVHEPGGDGDETRVYNDEYGNFDATDIYFGNRTLYNIFYARHMSGSTLLDRYGQAGFDSVDAHTKVATYEDGANYVLTLATNLEDMYVKDSADHAQVAAWSRETMYLRPNRFLVYDRTTAGNATGSNTADDQFLAFHFPANPIVGSAPAGEKRLDVTYNTTYAGAMTTILPANATTTTIGMYPANGSGANADAGSSPVKVWQVQVRAPTAAATQQWLTAFDLDATSSAVATASAITVASGNAIGGLFASGGSQQATLFNNGAAGTTIAGSIVYTVPKAQTAHIIAELPSNAGYTVAVVVSGATHTITVAPGGSRTTSPKGVLSFTVTPAGVVGPTDRIFADGFGG